MSLYDKASLVQIPSGYKSGTLYSVLPANGNGDFIHTRASSATRVNKDGLIESVASGVPRLDYPLIDGVVQDCPALLLEPSRSNFGRYSEQISSWSKIGVTASDNQTISPDGSQNAGKATVISASSGNHPIYLNLFSTVTSGNDYVLSLFVKKSTTKYIKLEDGYAAYGVTFNFDTEEATPSGNASNSDIGVEKYPNGWYRLSVHLLGSSTTHSQPAVYILRDSDAAQSYTGTDEAVFLWGLQMEAGTYHTSYVKNASTGTTTRSADVCNGAGTSAEFNDSEGVLFAEIAAIANDSSFKLLSINDGSSQNMVNIGISNSDNNMYVDTLIGSTSAISNGAISANVETYNKLLVKYKSGSNSIYLNGFKINSNTNTFTAIGSQLNELEFRYYTNTLPFYGRCKQLMTFNEALTDSELEQVTSWTSFGEMAKGQLYSIE